MMGLLLAWLWMSLIGFCGVVTYTLLKLEAPEFADKLANAAAAKFATTEPAPSH